MTTAAIYPGSFDPLTNGHIDIVKRALVIFDRVVLAIANNPNKEHMFSIEERTAMAKECLGEPDGLEYDTFDGLLVEYAKRKSIGVMLRGLRAVSDFDYEFQLASMNRKLAPDIETVLVMASEENFYVSSKLVKEVASFGGDVSQLIPPPALVRLKQKLS